MTAKRSEANALRKPGRPKDPDLEQRRRAEILAVAASVFARTGYAETDVQVVADQVGVGKGTVYRYFATKKDLFLAAVDQGLNELSVAVDAVILDEALSPLDRFAGAMRAYLRFFAARPEMVELFIQERAVFRDRHQPLYFAPKFDERCEATDRFVLGLIERGILRELKLEQLRDVLSDLLYGTILTNSFTKRKCDPTAQTDNILNIIFLGILGDGERREYLKRTGL